MVEYLASNLANELAVECASGGVVEEWRHIQTVRHEMRGSASESVQAGWRVRAIVLTSALAAAAGAADREGEGGRGEGGAKKNAKERTALGARRGG